MMTEHTSETPEPTRAIELEIAVDGTPDQVWEAIATGPGISAWFVPTVVDGRAGGAIAQSFGEGEEMQVQGHVQHWDPPRRFAYGEQPEPTSGMAFEFLVESRGAGSCIVRLINSGFGYGEGWDDQYDATEHGWRIFLQVLALHLKHFVGQRAERIQAMAMVPAANGADEVWARLLAGFELSGDEILAGPVGELTGSVAFRATRAAAVRISGPTPGTVFLAVEGAGELLAVSAWLALYGPDAAAVVARDAARWQSWLEGLAG